MKTAELTILNLCEQVDYWKAEAEKYKDLYEKEAEENKKTLREARETLGEISAITLRKILCD